MTEKEKLAAYMRDWRANHRERWKEIVMASRKKHIDQYREYQRNYHREYRQRKKHEKETEE